MGRFLNADAFASTGQGILGNNMFAYCGNNPVNCSDPTGESALLAWLGDAVIDGLIGGFVNGVCTFATGGSWNETLDAFWLGFGEGFVVGLFDEAAIVFKIAHAIVTFDECMKCGAGWGKSLLATAICLFAAFSLGPTGSKNVDRLVDLTFGLGASLVSSGVTEGIKQSAVDGFVSMPKQYTVAVTKTNRNSHSGTNCRGFVSQIAFSS